MHNVGPQVQFSRLYGAGQFTDHMVLGNIKELRERVDALELMNHALWEFVREQQGLTHDALHKKMEEVDARDGVKDDRVTPVPLRCPACQRVSTSRHWRCLYCGQNFARYKY